MGAYKDKNGTWYAQFRFTNWKGEADRKTKRGFATKKEALEWEREFLTQSAGNLEMTFEAFYELYKKNLQDRLKKNTWKMKTSVIESKILPYFKKKRIHHFATQALNLVPENVKAQYWLVYAIYHSSAVVLAKREIEKAKTRLTSEEFDTLQKFICKDESLPYGQLFD